MSMSEAEIRREERRKRILNNSDARLQRILGGQATEDVSSSKERIAQDYVDGIDKQEPFRSVNQFGITKSNQANASGSFELFGGISNAGDCRFTQEEGTKTDLLSSPADPAGNSIGRRTGGQNEATGKRVYTLRLIHHQILLFTLSLVLTLYLTEVCFLTYLAMYEMLIFALNAFSFPSFYDTSKTNMILTALMLFGVPEIYRRRIQTIMGFFSWISTDITFFIFCTLVSHTLLYLLHT